MSTITVHSTTTGLWIHQNELRLHVRRLEAAGFNAAAEDVAERINDVSSALLRLEKTLERHEDAIADVEVRHED